MDSKRISPAVASPLAQVVFSSRGARNEVLAWFDVRQAIFYARKKVFSMRREITLNALLQNTSGKVQTIDELGGVIEMAQGGRPEGTALQNANRSCRVRIVP